MNLALSLLYAAERTPDAEALVAERGAADLRRAARARRAHRRRTRGARRRVAETGSHASSRTSPRRSSCTGAVSGSARCVVPLSHRISNADLEYCIADCGAEVVIRDQSEVRELAAADEHPGALDLDEREPSIQLYTSGTTGRPKGVPRSHRAERAGGTLAGPPARPPPGSPHARRHAALPHDGHPLAPRRLASSAGASSPSRRGIPSRRCELIERERIDTLYLAPTLYYDLVHHPRLDRRRHVVAFARVAYAGSPMTSALVEGVAAAFEPEIFVNHYGSTEIYTFSVHRDQRAKPGCAGRAALNARLRLDPSGEGEILCHMSSDEAFAGYWNRPDADAKAIRDGWYHTGDVGPDRRGRRPLGRRPRRRHGHLGRREHPPRRGRGRARARAGCRRGRGRRRAGRPAGGSASSPTSSPTAT